jgi:hypothetical protein
VPVWKSVAKRKDAVKIIVQRSVGSLKSAVKKNAVPTKKDVQRSVESLKSAVKMNAEQPRNDVQRSAGSLKSAVKRNVGVIASRPKSVARDKKCFLCRWLEALLPSFSPPMAEISLECQMISLLITLLFMT